MKSKDVSQHYRRVSKILFVCFFFVLFVFCLFFLNLTLMKSKDVSQHYRRVSKILFVCLFFFFLFCFLFFFLIQNHFRTKLDHFYVGQIDGRIDRRTKKKRTFLRYSLINIHTDLSRITTFRPNWTIFP